MIFETLFNAEIACEHTDKAIFVILVLPVALRDHKLHSLISLVGYFERKDGARSVGKEPHNVFFCVLVYKPAYQKVVKPSATKAVKVLRGRDERNRCVRIFSSRCKLYEARGARSRIAENDVYCFHNILLAFCN